MSDMRKELIDVVRKLKELDNTSTLYLDSVPREFIGIMVDNPYSDSQWQMYRILSMELFGTMYEDIQWFLTEWNPDRNFRFWFSDGTEICIKCEDDYYKYLEGC